MGVDYSSVTEVTGSRVSKPQLERLVNRYALAAEFCRDKDVLEVACGSGQGLGLLAENARWAAAGDYTENLLAYPAAHYKGRIPLIRLDAQQLPFADDSFDVIVFYEAIYYLPHAERFVAECRRVLRRGGVVIIGQVNPEWKDFNPSPFTHKYYSAAELAELLRSSGFEPEIRGAFPAKPDTFKDYIVSALKRIAVALHLIPKTMKGKELLKRIVFGKLQELKPELRLSDAPYVPPAPIDPESESAATYTILYAIGTLRT